MNEFHNACVEGWLFCSKVRLQFEVKDAESAQGSGSVCETLIKDVNIINTKNILRFPLNTDISCNADTKNLTTSNFLDSE